MDALRAFASAARTLSLKRAAQELHVSPSALSRRVQALEEHLGTALFRRLNPGLALTDAGARYLATVEAVLAELRAAQDTLAQGARPLRVSALESFCAKWLVPRLAGFEAGHPALQLDLEATLRYADFTRDSVDVAIRFGRGPWEGLHSEPLVDLEFFPVCSPALLDGDPALRCVEDLALHTLIHLVQVPRAWRDWLRRAGSPDLSPRREVTYDHVAIALSAAEAGQGVALVSDILAEPELREGRLCAPFELRSPSVETYHLVCREESLSDPRVVALRDWLVEALAATRGAIANGATARAQNAFARAPRSA